MATLTRYESFEELKASKKAISKELFAQKLENNKHNEFEEFVILAEQSYIRQQLEDKSKNER